MNPNRRLQFVLTILLSLSIFLLLSGLGRSLPGLFPPLAVLAQSEAPASTLPTALPFSPSETWRVVYERWPDFPRENQYINTKTGAVDVNNTLLNRLIRYHTLVKGRPVNYRLDWKLTLADYLGANEFMEEGAYPGRDVLNQNPLEGDRTVIQKLDRAGRERLVNALLQSFNPNAAISPVISAPATSPPSSTPATSSPNPVPSPRSESPARPRTPKPGDAQLLL